MRVTRKLTETIRFYIPTEGWLEHGHQYNDIAQMTFDAGYSRGRVLPERIVWPGNVLHPPDEEVCLEYHRFIDEEHEISWGE